METSGTEFIVSYTVTFIDDIFGHQILLVNYLESIEC